MHEDQHQTSPNATQEQGESRPAHFSSFNHAHWLKVRAARMEQGLTTETDRHEVQGHPLTGTRVRHAETGEEFTVLRVFQGWLQGWYRGALLKADNGRVHETAILSYSRCNDPIWQQAAHFQKSFAVDIAAL